MSFRADRRVFVNRRPGPPFPRGPPRERKPQIDREKTCPMLLRVFTSVNSHHTVEEFAERGEEPVKDELQIYTWMNATLRELTDLIRGVRKEATRGSRLSFAFVFPGRQGSMKLQEVGNTTIGGRSPDDRKTLEELKFEIGDFVDVAIFPREPRAAVMDTEEAGEPDADGGDADQEEPAATEE